MKPATFSVKNSLFVNLVSVLIIVVGIYQWFHIKQEAFPNVSYDWVTITTVYAGATPQEIEKLITIPLEEELAEVDDVKEIQSISAENLSTIWIEIDPDTRNKNKVVQDIQRAVDRERDLPDDIEDDPLVTEIQTKNIPFIQVSLTGLPEKELRTYTESLKDKFQDINGVAAVRKNGWHEREIRVEIDPDKVQDYYLSLDEIMAALKNKNLNLPGGTLKTGPQEYLIRTMGEFETAEEIENVIIRANESGNWIRIKDIATVNDTFEDEDTIFKTNGEVAINLTVIKRESADTLKVVKKVKETIKQFQTSIPSELKINTFDDLSYYIKRRLNVLKNNGIIGIIFIILCLLFFLQTRVALLTALGLPIAFGATLIMMAFFGISINLISMFGMIIVLGMLVDDGIIIAENSYRYIEQGVSPKEAAVRVTNEVTKPVIATILTTVAFFFPLFMMTGLMGKYTRHIPQVVILMLAASLLEALFILPSHIADFARPVNHEKKRTRLGDRFFRFLVNYYEKMINFVVEKRYLVLLATFMIIIIALFLNHFFIKFILFSPEGIEEFFVHMEAPVGTHLNQTNTLVRPVEELIKTLPPKELENFVTTVGSSGDSRDFEQIKGTHLAQIQVYLTPSAGRKRKTKTIVEYLRSQAKNVEGFDKLTFDEVHPGPPVGKPIEVHVRGEQYGDLKEISLRIQDYLKTLKGVRDIKDDFSKGKEELRVIIDEEKATRLFLTTRAIAQTVRFAFEGGIATDIKTTDEEVDVIVQFPKQKQLSMDTFNSILVPNAYNKLIPFNKVTTLEIQEGISAIKHRDRKRVITISANVDEELTTSAEVNKLVTQEFKDITKEYLDVTISYGGEQEDTMESMRSLGVAFIWGLLIVFLILASTFGSLIQPVIVLTSIPLGLVGVIYVFFIHGQSFGFMAIMGSIGLAGVAVNDAIVLVDFINTLRKQGIPRRESIIQAGKLRLRPVILTTITTVSGLMPVAYGWGGSDPIIKPMALALGWGLAFATFSTLLIIPTLYAIIDDIRGKTRKALHIKKPDPIQTANNSIKV
ncbi:MAG: efflux RND transporter permease subunit [Candidatus Omnitrophica bacterium]|nr:efflux RND transporter permease subunit [Candidatus Omnitrophota bacterium]